MKLHELAHLANTIEEKLLESSGEITEDIEAMLTIRDENLPDTIERYAFSVDKMKSAAQLYHKRANDLLKIAKGMENMSDNLIKRVDKYMTDNNLLEVTGHEMKFKRVGCAKSLVISDPSKIPDAFSTFVPETTVPNKDKIKKALSAGEEVPGASLSGGSYIKISVNKS